MLGPVCLILLALLFALTVMHSAHDQIQQGELIVCIAFLISAIVLFVVPPLCFVRVVADLSSRAPPVPLRRPRNPIAGSLGNALIPLRL